MSQYSSADFYSNCAFLATQPADPGPTFVPFDRKSAPSAIRAVAGGLAEVNGEKTPTDMQFVYTHRSAAAKLMSQSDVDSDQDVYLVSMSGAFIGNVAKVPSGADKPRGNVLSMTIDPTSGRVIDWGIEFKNPNLASLGIVQSLS